MITWAEKIAFVGMIVEPIPSDTSGKRYSVKLRIPNGISSFGSGDTIEDAIESAAIGMNMSWGTVTKNITEKEWQRISHL